MKEIQMSQVIFQKRKEKQLTQDDLAKYLGVSKAAISKWETGQSYPDITFLPILASYFDISIDELIGYEPQLTEVEIKKLYQNLCQAFVTQPFESVILECQSLIKKYYSCPPLLHQIGLLYMNHSMLANTVEQTAAINEEAKQLFSRVKSQTNDVELAKLALHLESCCCLLLNQAQEALDLLGEANYPKTSSDVLKATAYQMLGNLTEAKMAIQIGVYQHLMDLFQSYTMLLTLYDEDRHKFEEKVESWLVLAEAFNIRKLNPYLIMPHLLIIAQGYVQFNEVDKALHYLSAYVDIVKDNIFPLQLKGNQFFDLIDPWLAQNDVGTAPRNEAFIKQSVIDGITKNPVFLSLQNDSRYIQLIEKLKFYL